MWSSEVCSRVWSAPLYGGRPARLGSRNLLRTEIRRVHARRPARGLQHQRCRLYLFLRVAFAFRSRNGGVRWCERDGALFVKRVLRGRHRAEYIYLCLAQCGACIARRTIESLSIQEANKNKSEVSHSHSCDRCVDIGTASARAGHAPRS
ncbi:unnamed protein product [Leptosia nina]|uniref:Uncharacterized protein n=1 Tax=Leptosia nina TaxID=320188 RepID=A0AAV1J704_9NEOP